MRRRVYIVRGKRHNFGTKNNKVNRFTKAMNRFRQEEDKPEKKDRL